MIKKMNEKMEVELMIIIDFTSNIKEEERKNDVVLARVLKS